MPAESLRQRVARLVDPISFADCYTGTGLKEHRRRDALATADAILSELLPLLREAGEGLEQAAAYVEALGDNICRNDVDCRLDPCESPSDVVIRTRAIHAKIKELIDAEG